MCYREVNATSGDFFMPSSAETPSLSTDQMMALVELARHGSLRSAAEALFLSEQGLRNRLIALEARLGVELYHKRRGVRRHPPLTEEGRRLLPHAVAFLQRAAELTELFQKSAEPQEVHVAASQYLIAYALIDVVRRFHAAEPAIRIRLSARTEDEIDEAVRSDPQITLGVAAPYEASTDLEFRPWFSMPWSLIAPTKHALLAARRLRLEDLAKQPLILYERGSTGRAHVLDAFRHRGLTPRIELEATNTDLIVRMVEAGLGVSIVPLHPSGAVTRGRRVGVRPLKALVRPIDSGILTRKGERLSAAAQKFIAFCEAVQK
jgi:DNA-binding transcriptional LysR family regulator